MIIKAMNEQNLNAFKSDLKFDDSLRDIEISLRHTYKGRGECR